MLDSSPNIEMVRIIGQIRDDYTDTDWKYRLTTSFSLRASTFYLIRFTWDNYTHSGDDIVILIFYS